MRINRIYDGVEAEKRKSKAFFRLFSLMRGLKMCLRFHCLGLNTVIDYFFHRKAIQC